MELKTVLRRDSKQRPCELAGLDASRSGGTTILRSMELYTFSFARAIFELKVSSGPPLPAWLGPFMWLYVCAWQMPPAAGNARLAQMDPTFCSRRVGMVGSRSS